MAHDLYLQIPALPVLLPAWLVGVTIALARLKRRNLLTPGRLITTLTTATYVAALLAVTLLPLTLRLGGYSNRVPWYEKVNLVPIVTIDVRTFVLNVVLTVPLGLLLPLITRVQTPRRAALVGLLVSLAVELSQTAANLVFSSGRVGDPNDLLANTLGAVTGWYVHSWLRSSRRCAQLFDRLTVPAHSAVTGSTTDDAPALTRW